jgi:hypothetical protein
MRTLVVAIGIMFTCANASASEAMAYAGAYECNAVLINKGMVEICAAQSPALAIRSKAAYDKWITRNSVKAEAEKMACDAQLHQLERERHHEEKHTDDEQKRLIQRISQEILDNFKARLVTEGPRACDEALFQLETGAGAMDFK